MIVVKCYPRFINVYDPNTDLCPICEEKLEKSTTNKYEIVSMFDDDRFPLLDNTFRRGGKVYREVIYVNMSCYLCTFQFCGGCNKKLPIGSDRTDLCKTCSRGGIN